MQPDHDRQSASDSIGATPQLSIVIPAYNEAKRIADTLTRIASSKTLANRRVEIIVVDDGSTDETARRVKEVAERLNAATGAGNGMEPDRQRLRVLSGESHRGKGFAVRRGALESQGDVVLMCDADLSTPINQLDRLLPWLDRGFDVVIGSRRMDDSVLDPPQAWTRRVMDAVFRAIRRRVILPEIRDTQCGFKCFTRAAARDLFSRATMDGFIFDCEILERARRSAYRIKEVGVVWRNDRDSRVRPIRDSIAMLIGVWRIRRNDD